MRLDVLLMAGVMLGSSLVSAQNLLVNPDFDLDPSDPGNGWVVVGTGRLTFDTGDGYPAAPSAYVDCAGDEYLYLQQCVAIPPGATIDFGAHSLTWFSSVPSHNRVAVSFFAGSDCGGTALGTEPTTGVSFPGGGWAYRWAEDVVPPVGAGSARLDLIAEANSAQVTIVWDTIYLGNPAGVFFDGFESGDPGAWSAVVVGP